MLQKRRSRRVDDVKAAGKCGPARFNQQHVYTPLRPCLYNQASDAGASLTALRPRYPIDDSRSLSASATDL